MFASPSRLLVIFTCALSVLAVPATTTASETVVVTAATGSGNSLLPATTSASRVFTDTKSAPIVSVSRTLNVTSIATSQISTSASASASSSSSTSTRTVPITTIIPNSSLISTEVINPATSSSASVSIPTATALTSGASRVVIGGMTVAALAGASAFFASLI